MDGIKLLLVLVLALGAERTYSQQPSNFRLLTGSESRELELGQNPELREVLARTGERVLINITGEESTAILQEGVNALLDCLPFLRRFPGGQISWFSRRIDQIGDPISDDTMIIQPDDRIRVEGEFNRYLNITRTNIVAGAEDIDSGVYTCRVCVAQGTILEDCRNASTRVYLLGSPPDVDCGEPDDGPVDVGPGGFARYRVGTNFCLRFNDMDRRRITLDCQIIQRDLSANIPGALPEPDRTWDRNGVILYSVMVGGNPTLTMEFFDDNPYLMPGIVSPSGLPLTALLNGSLALNPYFENITMPGVFPPDSSVGDAQRLAFNNILGTWTCSSSNSLGEETCSSTIRECGPPPSLPGCSGPLFPDNNETVPVGCSVNIIQGTRVTLDCGVVSGLTPEITYLWVHNGMENISMERTLMVNSEGNYTCEVSNLDGVDTQTSMVFYRQGQVLQVGISRQTGATLLQGVFPSNQVFTVSEGDQFQLCVEIIEGRVQQEGVVAVISSINGSAFSGSDFRQISTNVTFPPGSSAGDQACISVPIYSDGVLERSEETFQAMVSPLVTQSSFVSVPFDRRYAIVTIVDTNIVEIGFEQSSYTVSETSPVLDVCVRLSGAPYSTTTLMRPVVLRVASQGETATAGQDYREITPHIAHFPPSMLNISMWCFPINILDDEVIEGSQPESFVLSLSIFDVAMVISQNSATVYILDDDEGFPTPEPTTTGTPPLTTQPPTPPTQPPTGPLTVSFSGNTPHVEGNNVTVQVSTNKPASATCRLGRVATMPCPPGSTTVFENVPPNFYSLRVTATTGAEEAEVFWKVYVPARPTICSVNLINFGVVLNGTRATVEFQGVGPTTAFMCRLDSGQFDSCVSPLSFSGLSPGDHRLRILPEGCPEIQGQTFRFTV